MGSAEVRAMLDELENVYDEVKSDEPAPFSCIVAPSCTGKTQLAATAALACRSVVYLYTGADVTPSTIQKFYKPHGASNLVLLDALKKVSP